MAIPVSTNVGSTGVASVDGLLMPAPGSQFGSSWSFNGSRVITYGLYAINSNSYFASDEIEAIEDAFSAWESVANIRFVRLTGTSGAWTYDPDGRSF